MSLFPIRKIQNVSLFSYYNTFVLEPLSLVLVRNYAARKGTRERKKKAKVKTVVEKVGFIPHNLRNKHKLALNRPIRKFDDSMKKDPIDDVFVVKYFKWIVYPFVEAVQCHKETHHPEMYNKPNANLHVSIELNMQGEKKTRLVDNFTRIVAIPNKFDHGEDRSIIAFSKSPDNQKTALEAGANLSGGVELIKRIQTGNIALQDYQYVVAHPEILPEMVVLRGLLKRKFPAPKLGTLDIDMGGMVTRLLHGIKYTATKDEYEKDFGIIETILGTLDMDAKQLEGNFAALIRDVYKMKPRRPGTFISRCLLWSPPSREKLKVNHGIYLDVEEPQTEIVEEEDVEEKMAL